MKVVMKLTFDQARDLASNKDLAGVCILPYSDDLKDKVKDFLKEKTGFNEDPCVGIVNLFGSDTLSSCWENLASVVNIHEGDFIVEFSMPDDLVYGISFDDYTKLCSTDNLNYEEVAEKLETLDLESSYMTLGFTPMLFKKYCTDCRVVKPSWDIESMPVDRIPTLRKSDVFGDRL